MDVLFERWKLADGLLPVVARDDISRLVGVVSLDELTRFLSSPDLGELETAAPAAPVESGSTGGLY
jgi:hypothetical protein